MDDFQNKPHFKKSGEVDPLLAPTIIPRPRYELVLTGDQDRFQIGHESLTDGTTWNLETAWRSFQQALICIIIVVVFVGIIYWGIQSERHKHSSRVSH